MTWTNKNLKFGYLIVPMGVIQQIRQPHFLSGYYRIIDHCPNVANTKSNCPGFKQKNYINWFFPLISSYSN